MRKRPLMLIACVFLTGLACQKYDWKVLAVVGLLLVLREYWIGWRTKNIKKAAGRSLLLLSAFFLGIFHMWQENEFRATYMSKIEDGSRVTVWGELVKWESTEYGFRGVLSNCYINLIEETNPCNDIMVYTSNDHYKVGQIFKITGKVNMFSEARNQGNFDAKKYYQSMKIDFAVDEETSVVLEEEGNKMTSMLISFREEISMVYDRCMSEKAAGFYNAMVLGDKLELDEALKKLFLLGGISHILAISGLHVSILGRGIYRFIRLSGVGFFISGICGSILLISYCMMVGNSTSTIRAVGMMLVFFWAQWIGRSYDMLNALGGMVLILLWDNPFLIENSGFWFSVTALLGVGFVGRELFHKEKENNRKKIGIEGFWMSVGITLTTLPITAMSYCEVPVYSPFVNAIVLPFLTPVFCIALIGGILGVFFPMIEVVRIVLLPCEWLLAYYEWICKMVEKLPGACMMCGKPEWWQIVLYYGVLFVGTYVLYRKKREWKKDRKGAMSYTIMRICILVVCGLCIFYPKEKPFEITFLDVGQGDGIYISAGDRTTYFIDGGSSSVDRVGEYRILPFLKAKRVNKIDYWFVSHCDSDHISGLLEILENRYKIEHIVLYERSSKMENYLELMKKAKEKGVKVIHMDAGDKICSRNMEITCLYPKSENNNETDINDSSLVLQVEWNASKKTKGFRALFAGDISTEIESVLYKEGIVQEVDLFKANHHGSRNSNSEEFLKVIRPKYIVVSCAKNNRYGHPSKQAVKRMEEVGAEIFYTMENGQVTFPLIQ